MTVLYPYRRLSEPTIDVTFEPQLPKLGDLSSNLAAAIGSGLDTVCATVNVVLPRDPSGSTSERLSAVTVLRCGSTDLRVSVPMTIIDGDEEMRWEALVPVPIHLLRGEATLRAHIGECIDGGRTIAVSESLVWTLVLDEVRHTSLKGGFPIYWRDFASEPRVDDKFKNAVWHLDLTSGHPELLLNSNERLEGLRQLLPDEGPPDSPLRPLHDVLVGDIGSAVWTALVMSAVRSIRRVPREDGSFEYDWPTEKWQVDVLRTVLPILYPGTDVDLTLETVCAAAVEVDFAPQVALAVQAAVTKADSYVARALHLALRTADEEVA